MASARANHHIDRARPIRWLGLALSASAAAALWIAGTASWTPALVLSALFVGVLGLALVQAPVLLRARQPGGQASSARSRLWSPVDLLPLAFTAACMAVRIPSLGKGVFHSDFAEFIASGAAWRAGLDPYAVDVHAVDGTGQNLTPPLLLPLWGALSSWSISVAFDIWRWAMLALYVALAFLLVRRARTRPGLVGAVWVLSLTGLWDTLTAGQVYIALLAFVAAAWVWLDEGHEDRAGVALGLLAVIKPNFALWPVCLFLAGRRRAAVVSGLVAVGLTALSLTWSGPDALLAWARAGAREVLFLNLAASPQNMSLYGAARRAGAESLIPWLSTGLVVLVLALAYVRRGDWRRVSGLGLLGALLAAPVAWTGYMLLLVPWLLDRWRQPIVRVVGLLLCVPLAIVASLQWSWDPLGQYFTVLLLVLLASEAGLPLPHWQRAFSRLRGLPWRPATPPLAPPIEGGR